MSIGPIDICWSCQMQEHDKCDGRTVMGHLCQCGCPNTAIGSMFAKLGKPKYFDIWELLTQIGGEEDVRLRKVMTDYYDQFTKAMGSRVNHQAWEGGYLHHVVETMNIAIQLYESLSHLRTLPFTLKDALIVMFLHDLEKPFTQGDGSSAIGTYAEFHGAMAAEHHPSNIHPKVIRRAFRDALAEHYDVKLTDEQKIALRYVEGEGDDYSWMGRKMNELGAFCNMCDIASARLWHDKGKEGKW